MKGYENLIVWQKSMDLVEEVYRISRLLPSSEVYGLASQMCRSAVSIPSNIAEGYDRDSTREYVHFLYIAKGSRAELYTQLTICRRTGILSQGNLAAAFMLSEEVGKMLNAMISRLKNKS